MENTFGLVYRGALAENIDGEVNIHPVSYSNSNGIDISANIYTPRDYAGSGKNYPAIVIAHPNGGVKEQVSGLFAQKLAEAGFVTLAFDAAFQGASGGLPRNMDIPSNRIEDIRAGADYLSQYPGVDGSRLGALGICGGGGYVIAATATDRRFKTVATLSMFNSGRVRRNGIADSQTDTVQDRLDQASAARNRFVHNGVIDYVGEFLAERTHLTREQLEEIPAGLYRDGVEYYGDTHYHPNAQSRYTTMSLLDLMAFDAEDHANLLTQPLLMIAGESADTRYMTDAVFNKATEAHNKERYLIEGATHIDTYWKEPYVTLESEKLIAFFNRTL